MKLAHFADCHLGFSSGYSLTPSGANQRLVDVAASFKTCIDQVLDRQPDAVVVPGDFFHSVRPANSLINLALRQMARLVKGIRGPVVISSGNHDTPRSSDTGDILLALREVGVKVVTRAPEWIDAAGLGILAVPHAAMTNEDLTLDSAGHGERTVLMLHGDATERREDQYNAGDGWRVASIDQDLAEWSYIALGHYHVAHEVSPRCWYSGSLDYCSSNPWAELVEEKQRGLPGKGWNLVDLDTGAVEFIHIPTRRHVDLPRFSAEGMTPAQVMEQMATRIEGENLDGAFCRLVITDLPRHVLRELDQQQIKTWKARAMGFRFDPRPPERKPSGLFSTLVPEIEDQGENLPDAELEPGSIAEHLDRSPEEWQALAASLGPPLNLDYEAFCDYLAGRKGVAA